MESKDIIKALEYRAKVGCELCDIKDKFCCENCHFTLMKNALNLIKNQQAEIEKLTMFVNDFCETGGKLLVKIKTAKTEAYKEFAEKLKEKYINDKRYDRPNAHTLIDMLFANIDKTLDELTEKFATENNVGCTTEKGENQMDEKRDRVFLLNGSEIKSIDECEIEFDFENDTFKRECEIKTTYGTISFTAVFTEEQLTKFIDIVEKARRGANE